MMCQRSGRPPTSIIGLGRNYVSSRSRVPRPPHKTTTFMRSKIAQGLGRPGFLPPEVEALDLGVGEQARAGAFEAVASELEDVAAVGDCERARGVLLDKHEREPGVLHLDELLEDHRHELRRQAQRRLVAPQQPRRYPRGSECG